jgi:hypothetical protein
MLFVPFIRNYERSYHPDWDGGKSLAFRLLYAHKVFDREVLL